MTEHVDARGRRAPTPTALSALDPVPDGYRILPDPLYGQPLMRVPRPPDVRLLLDRSRESAQAGEPTQDYLAVRCDQRRLTFAVTDGVGSSFLGDVAAQILATQLADWLARPPAQAFAAALTAFLSGLSQQVAEQVAAWPLPSYVSGLVRAALDQQRAYGSEAMFACGVVDLVGGRDAKVTVAWLGDARLRVILRDGQLYDHSGQTADRWSSRLGPRGEVGSRTWPVREVARVIACTDGLVPELEAAVTLPDAELSDRLEALARRPGNDDMALVDVGLAARAMPAADGSTNPTLWRRLTEEPTGRHARTTPAASVLRRLMRAVGPSGAPLSTAEPPQPAEPEVSTVYESPVVGIAAPADVAWHPTGQRGELTWSPVTGADSYAVELCREPTFAEPLLYAVRGVSFALPPMPGPVFVRVRSVGAGTPGPWGRTYGLSGPSPTGAP
jgi:hypothetical protein